MTQARKGYLAQALNFWPRPVSSFAMRHWILAVLIALLPLRGWVGDAMAMQMLGLNAPAVADEHRDRQDHPAALEAAHTGHAASIASHSPIASDHVDSDASHSHIACDLCNGPAMALGEASATAPNTTHPRLVFTSDSFASATLPQGVKPPIS